ncbi:M23 family metallopeptidase [Paenibacillus aquistagni]|uniref:Murein DD-endopeptidase MepM and murein hydrolase activator NlpD, contain LysM domain n=1 Tax=Paenibacillus aquistagni TaxID=1852522 RepID=A0A1X7K8H2_9BACL|nr:peptidoglycan DD-metalloendopeptidase family protein [Paenibacillus aquistagni]SMG37373.1 Murein DD-endopeptidase MepM and murein hydrolase activator NlpD, contain LysM domain [Paenibacillus aquistagni]
MKQRLRSNSMTVLVIREAERAVKQVRVPKLLVISVPIAALMSVSGLILSMQLTSQQSIHDLEDQLEQQKMALEITVNNKDEMIRTLRQEVIRLAKETKIVQDQMDQIHDLEQELEQFVKQHISEDAVSSRSSNAPSLITLVQADIDDDDSLLRLAEQSSFNLKRVQEMLNEVEKTTPRMLTMAKEQQQHIARTPSYWPTNSRRITSSFGYRTDPITGHAAFHAGLDIGGKIGDPIYAAAEGKVLETGYHYARGNYIILSHRSGLESWYMHLSKAEVDVGAAIEKGERIGTMGTTGHSTGPHLHFQIVQKGTPIDPYPYLQAEPEQQGARLSSAKNRS